MLLHTSEVGYDTAMLNTTNQYLKIYTGTYVYTFCVVFMFISVAKSTNTSDH